MNTTLAQSSLGQHVAQALGQYLENIGPGDLLLGTVLYSAAIVLWMNRHPVLTWLTARCARRAS